MSMKSGFKRCWHPIGLVTRGQPFGRMNVLHDMSQSNTGTSPVTEHKMYCEKNYYVQTSKDKRAMLIEKNPFSSCSIILLYVHRVKILLWLVLLSYLLNLTCVRMTEILYKVNYCSSCTLTSVSHVVLPSHCNRHLHWAPMHRRKFYYGCNVLSKSSVIPRADKPVFFFQTWWKRAQNR